MQTDHEPAPAWCVVDTPVGALTLAGDGAALVEIVFDGERHRRLRERRHAEGGPGEDGDPVLERARVQLLEYFDGGRTEFDLPLNPTGSAFQQRVWRGLQQIPYGRTWSYGDLARAIGMTAAASRAVGLANGANPLSIVVPCHRVIGADGSLTGYGGGLERKQFLLDLERGSLF